MFTDCQPGYYGNKCQQPCSGHCLNNLVCKHIEGTCGDGCEAGYMDKLCNTCKTFYFPCFYILVFSLQMTIWITRRKHFVLIIQLSWIGIIDRIVKILILNDYKNFSHRHVSITWQLAGMGIMAKTVWVFVPQTAGHVNTPTGHVVVLLVGMGQTVLLVYISNSQLNLISFDSTIYRMMKFSFTIQKKK